MNLISYVRSGSSKHQESDYHKSAGPPVEGGFQAGSWLACLLQGHPVHVKGQTTYSVDKLVDLN